MGSYPGRASDGMGSYPDGAWDGRMIEPDGGSTTQQNTDGSTANGGNLGRTHQTASQLT